MIFVVVSRTTLVVTVFDKSARKDGTFAREDFNYDPVGDVYICLGGKTLTTTGTRE